MASVVTNLKREHMRRLVITVRVDPIVRLPLVLGIALIRLGARIAGLTLRIERNDKK